MLSLLSENLWFVGVNPEEMLEAKSASKTLGELSVFSDFLRKHVLHYRTRIIYSANL